MHRAISDGRGARWGLALALVLALAGCGPGNTPTATPAPTAAPSAPTVPVAAAATSLPATATGVPATATLAPGMIANPLLNRDFPDPDSLRVGQMYYVYATNAEDANIPVAESPDLVHWQVLGDALPALPAWAEPGNTWAPEVTTTADGRHYVMYFAARVAGQGIQCVGVATSDQPAGPFHAARETPFVCQTDQGGDIDPSSFVDDDGTRYLLWKNDGNCCGGSTWLYIQPISGDGLTLEGTPTQLIRQDQVWEGTVIEAPTLWKHGGTYYLFYSANDYRTLKYAVGYAVADVIRGPYHKASVPILQSHLAPPARLGPGGQDITVDGQGQTWLFYHAWDPTVSFRTLNIARLDWSGDTPVVQGGP